MRSVAHLRRIAARLPGERYVVDRPVDARGRYQLVIVNPNLKIIAVPNGRAPLGSERGAIEGELFTPLLPAMQAS